MGNVIGLYKKDNMNNYQMLSDHWIGICIYQNCEDMCFTISVIFHLNFDNRL